MTRVILLGCLFIMWTVGINAQAKVGRSSTGFDIELNIISDSDEHKSLTKALTIATGTIPSKTYYTLEADGTLYEVVWNDTTKQYTVVTGGNNIVTTTRIDVVRKAIVVEALKSMTGQSACF